MSASPEEINVRIAELCGYINQGKAKGVPALNNRWFKDRKLVGLPNYHGSLDACAEFEKTLTNDECYIYDKKLALEMMNKSLRERDGWTWHASPPQRCAAFIETKGLRSESLSEATDNYDDTNANGR